MRTLSSTVYGRTTNSFDFYAIYSKIHANMYGETRQVGEDTDIVGWDRFLVKVVQEFAEENDIKLDLISTGWIMRLQKDGTTRFIFGLDLGLNNSSNKLLARDKAATSDILELEGIAHIPHKLFLKPKSLASNPDGNWHTILKYYKEYGEDVVCKPNFGSSGMGVERATTQAELEQIMQKLLVENRAVAVSPYVEMTAEYRVTVLDGVAELVYKKTKENPEDLKFNLCKGAYAEEETNEEIRHRVSELAVAAANACGMRFTNVDVAAGAERSRSTETPKSNFSVLEMNSGVMFEHYAKQGDSERDNARAVYRKALAKLFK